MLILAKRKDLKSVSQTSTFKSMKKEEKYIENQ